MKTIVAPFVIAAVMWYWNRIVALNRYPYLLEKAIFALGLIPLEWVSLWFRAPFMLLVGDIRQGLFYAVLFSFWLIFAVPLEWVSLWFRAPFMLLVGDIRQGLFYAVLFSFWLIFAGEHLIDDTSRNNLASYWRNLTAVLVASTCLLVYDIAERGMQLSNPFFSIWASENGSKLAYTVVYIASICVIFYFCFLAYKVWKVWSTIKMKRSAQLYRTNEHRRLKVEAIIYRFKFLMFFTLVCAAFTVISYIMKQVEAIIYRFKFLMFFTLVCAAFTVISYIMKQYGEGQIHSDTPTESILVHSTSAFFTGTFGMWNIYVLLLLALYAPSHKHYANANGNQFRLFFSI
uniref:DUF418 domain-containing protein n=1 Tax=Ascaris lumbricoides TaxID=6252 RepID=A0A0M3IU44_ASCLU